MRVFKLRLNYAWSDEDKLKRDELIAKLKTKGYTFEDKDDYYHSYQLIVSETQLIDLIADGVTYESCKPFEIGEPTNLQALADQLTGIADKFSQAPDHDVVYNQHMEVHMPNSALHTYNETLLLEDACTDALQDKLDAGWRIIACCPQAQRRPDYILGHFNPDRTGQGAERP